MLRFAVLVGFFAAVCADPRIDRSKSINFDRIFVQSFNEYLARMPKADLFQQCDKEETQDGQQLKYTFGKRVDGDRLVATSNSNQQSTTPIDINTNVVYPNGGVGSTVTQVLIIVEQSSKDGRAYITSGGIGRRQISVAIEAKNIFFFSYYAQVFARDN